MQKIKGDFQLYVDLKAKDKWIVAYPDRKSSTGYNEIRVSAVIGRMINFSTVVLSVDDKSGRYRIKLIDVEMTLDSQGNIAYFVNNE